MNKILKTFLILASSVLFLMQGLSPLYAADKAQIDKELKRAQNQIKHIKLKQKLEVGKLYNNQKKLETTERNLNTSKVQYENAKNELERLRSELNRQISEYNEYQSGSSKRIVQIYKSKRSGYIEFLFSSGDINDFLDRIYYENLVMNIDKKTMANAKAKAATIRGLKQKMEQQKEYLASSIKTMDRQQKTIQNAIDKNKQMIYKLEHDRATWERSERELAKQSAQLEKFISLTAKNNKSTTVTAPTGGFIRPVSGPVTSPYGTRVHPIFKRVITHTGVDLGMPMGSPVKASNSGKVIFVGWYGGYGKVVIIDHGKIHGVPVSTLYAHLSSYRVSNGASVTKGQIIGNVGSTGYSTGPHLHFEVRENGRHVNPSKYAPI